VYPVTPVAPWYLVIIMGGSCVFTKHNDGADSPHILFELLLLYDDTEEAVIEVIRFFFVTSLEEDIIY
jgi:hypothetical protein